MPSGAGAQTWPDEFMPDLCKFIADGLTIDISRIFESIYEEQLHLDFPVHPEMFGRVYLPDFKANNYQVGAGAFNTAFDTTCITQFFIRLESDLEGKSSQYLNDQTKGLYVFAKQIITTLQTWYGPVDPDSDLYKFRHPLLLSPGFRIQPKTGREGTRWGVLTISWLLAFVGRLGSPYPN